MFSQHFKLFILSALKCRRFFYSLKFITFLKCVSYHFKWLYLNYFALKVIRALFAVLLNRIYRYRRKL